MGRTEVLNDRLREPCHREIAAHLNQIRTLRVAHLDERATGEIDTVVEPAHTNGDQRNEQQQARKNQGRLALPHEIDMRLFLQYFHI